MPITTGHQKVRTNIMKAYRRPRQYIYRHCQLGHVSPGLSLLVSVCVLMLPMLGLVDERVQLTTLYHMNPIHQWYIHPRHMTFSHTPLLLPSLNNVLPAMALQNRVARPNIGCPSYTSSHSDFPHRSPVVHLNLPSGLGRRVVGVVLTLLLLLSGDIETNPGPVGQQLSVNDLGVVLEALNKACVKWYNIGMQLGVEIDRLDVIKEQYDNPSDCLRETLKTWLKTYSSPTWSNIVDSLRSSVVGEVRLADDLKHKYCSTRNPSIAVTRHVPPTPVPVQPTTSQHLSTSATAVTQYSVLPSATSFPISEHPTPPPEMPAQPATVATPPHHPPQEHTVLLDKHSVKQHVEQLEHCFLELTECTYEILVEKGINVHRLHARLVSLDVSRRYEHQEFIDKHLMNIDQNLTFNNLWARLGSYWDFLNFDLLEHIINKFGIEDLKHKMESYKHDLQSFRRSTRLCDFIDCWPVRGQTPPETELRRFVGKVGYHWDSCTLEDLETLKGVITHKFFLPGFALQLGEIMEGSITITWLIPVPFVKVLQEAIETTTSEFFMELKIETVNVDGKVCYPSPAKKPIDYPEELTTHQTTPQPAVAAEKYTHKIEEEDTHKMEVAELKKLKQYFAEGKNSVKIVIAGKMGTGKTTLVNSLCGKQLAVEGHIAFSETTKFVSYTIAVDIPSEILEKTINVRVWDTPGLGDPFFDDEATAKEIAEKCQEADLLIYCLDIRGRFANDDATEIKLLTEALGQQMWKHAVFALTFANAVGANYGCVAVTELRKRIGSWTDAITHLMKEKLKFPHDIVDNISIIPAGYRHYQPPGIDDWFSLFWAASFTKTKPSAQSALLGITIRRLESALKTDQGGASEEMPIRLSVGALVGLVAGAAMPGPVGAAVGGAAGSGVGYVDYPTVLECIMFQGRWRTINIPREIGTKYRQFGIFLLDDTDGTRVSNMEHKYRGNAERINTEILQEWAIARGKKPVTWEALIEVLRDCELDDLASEIEEVRLPEKYKSEDHYLSICEQVMRGYGQMDQTVMHCIFVGPAGVGKSSLVNRLLNKKLHPKRTSTPVAEKTVQVNIMRDVSTAVAQVSGLQWQILEDPDTQASELIRQLSAEQKNYEAVNEHFSQPKEDTTQVSGKLPAKEKENDSSVEDVSTELAIIKEVTQVVEREVPEQTEVFQQELESGGIQTPGELLSTHSTSKGQFSKPLGFFRRVLKEKGVSELKHYINNPWTLYLTDSGGQPEFHELLPALVVGPSVFFVVFRLDKNLNEKYEVEFVRTDKETHIKKYISSLTLQEDLMRSLASIASTKYLDISGNEVKPKVILVATFKDKVPQEEDCQRKLQQIQDLVKETDVYREGMIVDASETQMVFTINNISDEEAERDAQKIRHAIQIIGEGFKICTPSPWLIFNILVQHEHARDSVISKEECFELAQECGIHEETEFEAALQFLHKQTGMLHYYKKPSELSQIVVRNPQHLFNRVNHLVEAFVFEKTHCSQHTNEFKRGIFERTVYETQTKEFASSELSQSMLLKLLEHLNVVVPLDDGEKYFMPCAIAHCDETTGIRSATIPPLLITFKSGYSPKGLFGALVACITNEQVAGCTLNLEESHIHQDQISFTMDRYSLHLRVHPTFIYIEVIPSNPDTPLSAFCTPCNSVRKLIFENLNKACKTLRYSDNANCSVSFQCSCDQQQKFHPAVLRDPNSYFWCTQSKKAVDVREECYVWLPQPTIIQNPESQSVAPGTEAVFRVKATGDILQFQWQKNHTDIHDQDSRYCGADTNSLHILLVEKGDEGCYRCLVKNYIGEKFAIDAVLTVRETQQDFAMAVQPTLQQQGTDGTSPPSTSQDSFAPSPKRPLQNTSHDSFAPSPKRPQISTYERPNLLNLLKFQDMSGKYINIPERIGINYFMFGVLLLNDETGAEVTAIITAHRENAAQINLEILRRWIGGKGRPLSWDMLVSVLEDIGLGNLAGDIKDRLHHFSFE